MTLEKYNQKRKFNETSEPEGKVNQSDKELLFVVQKHAASHLHYDFRLEMDGVLKSWAVPKGPSMNPEDKRLAMMVEDHPYDYKDFEGNIPEGNYGAGNVIVWDNGTYTTDDKAFVDNPEKKIKADLEKGRLSFILKGKKLKGEFSLVKLKGKQENAWLLIKKTDKYVSEVDILLKNKSVLSKFTLEALEKKNNKEKEIPTKKKISKSTAKNVKLDFVKPMLANTSEKVFDDKDWIFETKYDGYRTVAVITNDVHLFSRNQLSFNKNFQAIADELKNLNHSAIIDGEIVVNDSNGKSDFQLLQHYIKTQEGNLTYYVFDILNLDGNDTTNLKLSERKELLKLLIGNHSFKNIIYSEHIEEKGTKLFDLAQKQNWEGIIAKNALSQYKIGKRSNDWLKIKISKQEEAIIIGITEPQKARNYFGAILLGQYDGEQLKFIGKCGTGFSENTLEELYLKFKPLFIDKPPIASRIPKEKVQWLKPKIVAQIKFTEWTQDEHLRHPVFFGLRIDKIASEVLFSKDSNTIKMTKNSKDKKHDKENDFELKVGKVKLHLTNQNKIYFPDDGITKGEIVDYYNEVSDFILPYIKNRPQSLNRFPNGINGQSFYQKDIDLEKTPTWLKTKKIFSGSNKEYIDYLICNDKATLLYMANLGCIEINPWNSSIKNIEKPDWIVMDLDPAKDDFQEVIKTALVVKELMDELETDCYCKTSGASGLHIYIPMGAKYEYDTVKILAELLANQIVKRLPDTTTVERSINKRNQKLYVDFLQNRAGQTLASVYSVRPKPGATVSTPLEWSEVNEKLSPSQFTIKNVLHRLDKKGDIWKPVLGKGADVEKIIKKITENPDF